MVALVDPNDCRDPIQSIDWMAHPVIGHLVYDSLLQHPQKTNVVLAPRGWMLL